VLDTVTADWDPELYHRFARYRREPFEMILERMPPLAGDRIVDLGCGTGENTIDLVRRTPGGSGVGIDSSPAMIARANELRSALDADLAGRLRFELGDLRKFDARREFSLVFSNAALQWVTDHHAVLTASFNALTAGGRLVFQIPANEIEIAQMSIRQLAARPRWQSRLGTVAVPSLTVFAPEAYRTMMQEIGFADVECYYHVFEHPMSSPAEVIEWSRATSLRPFLSALNEVEQPLFLADLLAMLEAGYNTRGPFIFTFRRLFLWARRPS
jgi:trans-aconitate 2-methyltransferase